MPVSHHQPKAYLLNTEIQLLSLISQFKNNLTITVTEMKHQLTKMQHLINLFVTWMIDIYH